MASSMRNEQWLAFSQELANIIEKVGSSIVAVRGGGRLGASGIHWRPGLIVTTSHTIRRDEELSITLPDQSSAPATLVGRDPSTDVAALKFENAKRLSAIKTSSPTGLKVGHFVAAVGRSQLGDLAASAGIVARLGAAWRTWRGGDIDQLLRPDIRLYPGQSGSALVNAQGEVLGMNTAALARIAAITVPTATVDRVLDELLEHGHIRRPYLGVAMQTVAIPEDVGKKLKLELPAGLLVVHVEPDAPGSRAGLMLGDVILRIDGKAVGDLSVMQDAIRALRTGDQAKLAVLRGGELREFAVAAGDRPMRK